jgi:hypothetical protein
VFAGLQKARGTIELRGGFVATSTAGVVDGFQMSLATTAGGEPIPLDPAATVNRTVIDYRDNDTIVNDVTFTVAWVVGDGDGLLEPGELATVRHRSGRHGAGAGVPRICASRLRSDPVGAVIDITRQLPAAGPSDQLHWPERARSEKAGMPWKLRTR